MWVHFRFKDGSNPYIAIRNDSLFFMIGKYFVYQESEFGLSGARLERVKGD